MYRIGDRLINEHGAFCRMRIGRGNWSTGRKPATVLLAPPQIPHELTWDRNGQWETGDWLLLGHGPKHSRDWLFFSSLPEIRMTVAMEEICNSIDYLPTYLPIFIHVAPTWSIGHSWNASFHFSFLILVGMTLWSGDQHVARPLPTRKHRINADNLHALSGIRTQNLSARESESSSCLIRRGRCDRRID
jgi:hypothetical protein